MKTNIHVEINLNRHELLEEYRLVVQDMIQLIRVSYSPPAEYYYCCTVLLCIRSTTVDRL